MNFLSGLYGKIVMGVLAAAALLFAWLRFQAAAERTGRIKERERARQEVNRANEKMEKARRRAPRDRNELRERLRKRSF